MFYLLYLSTSSSYSINIWRPEMSQFESKDKILTLSKTSKSGSSQVPQLTWYIRGSGNLTSLDPIPRNPAGSSLDGMGLVRFPNPHYVSSQLENLTRMGWDWICCGKSNWQFFQNIYFIPTPLAPSLSALQCGRFKRQ